MEETDHSKSSEPETHHVSKKRRLGERVVVAVKLEENDKRQQQRNEGPPSDCWSWRKYGQKPIKGSPYPRGYYRCSTSKGCSAKKQVEKCKTDSSMLIVTYTSTHNHPGPGKSPSNRSPQNNQHSKQEQDEIITSSTPKQEQEESESESMVPQVAVDHLQHSQSALTSGDDPFEVNLQAPGELYREDLKSESEMMVPRVAMDSEDHLQHSQSQFDSTVVHVIPFEANLQTPVGPYIEDPKPVSNGDDDTAEFSSLLNSEENDFFDELEELPTSSFFTSLMKRSFCEDRVIVNPS